MKGKVNCLLMSTGIRIAWRIPAASCWMYVVLTILDRHTAEPPASEHGACGVEMATEKIESYK
jgi:hypothetical protein